ncbi:MAG TPA: serine hydrolase [Pirellulales bacterium]|nr:serine hydrolase [Pirellulales bacterium]
MALASASLFAVAAADDAKDRAVFPAADWKTAKPVSQGLSAAGVARVGEWLQQNGSKTGLMVRHGRIVGEWYFDGTDPTTQLLVYSTTKSFSSTATGIAIADGKLKLDTPLGQFFPDVQPPEKKQITVGQILSMTTGLRNNGRLMEIADPFSHAMLEAPLDARPGEKWDYNNTGLSLLTPLFHAATGQGIDEFLDARVFRPIGITPADWSWDRSADQPLPYSGLHITARALARFGLLVLRDGRWQKRQIVPAAWLASAARPSQSLKKEYGYLWWNNTQGKWPGVPADAFAAMGRFENEMLIVPSLDLIVIRQVGDVTGHEPKVNIAELFHLAVDAVDDRPAEGK